MLDLNRRQVALLVGGILGALALLIGLYGLLTGPTHEAPGNTPIAVSSTSAQVQLATPSAHDAAGSDPSLATLPRTTDPVAYARAIAAALFDWDTATGYSPADFQTPIVADADPSGEETPGLITDVTTYFPSDEQWLDLATMDVTQDLQLDSATVPNDWPAIAAKAHGELRPGTTAVTIHGTRHRTGTWNGVRSATSTPVAFTAFVACRPTFDRCHLLRLSEPGNPLG